MPTLKEILLDTPSSSGESEKFKEPFQRKKKLIRHGSSKKQSQIPQANSVQRVESASEQPSGDEFKKPSTPVPRSPFRKSLSQTDMKKFRRLNFNNDIALPKPKLTPTKLSKNDIFYVVDEPAGCGALAKAAGLKVFATIMLNAWRKRRDEVRRLTEEVDLLKTRSIKVKTQIHVLNSVFRNEQKQCNTISERLRHVTEDNQKLQTSLENLTESLIKARAEASVYEQQVRAKELENEALNNIISDTNNELFKSMGQIHQLEKNLSCEKANVQQLENQKNELLNELSTSEIKFQNFEEQHLIEIYHKDAELSKANSDIKMLEALLSDLKEKELQVRDLKKSEIELKSEAESLKSEISSLKSELEKCFTARVKCFWGNYVEFHRSTLLLFHILGIYLLPAIPPPRTMKLPIRLDMEKIRSIIRK